MPRAHRTRKREPSLRKSLATRRLMERVRSAAQEDFQKTRHGVRSRFEELQDSGLPREEASKIAIEEYSPSIDARSTHLPASGMEAGREQAYKDYELSSESHKRAIRAAQDRGGLLGQYIHSREGVTRKIRSLGQLNRGGSRRYRRQKRKHYSVRIRRKKRRRLVARSQRIKKL